MTQDHQPYNREEHNHETHGKETNPTEQPLSKLLREFGRLFLLFLYKLLLILWALLKLGLRQLLKYFCKAIILLWDLCRLFGQNCRKFWYDNDTQAKIRLAKKGTKKGLKKLARWIVIALKLTLVGLAWTGKKLLQGLIWLLRETIRAIIHLGPTLKALGQLIVKGSILFWHLCRKATRALARFFLLKKRAYQRFRKNKGFKGLLVDMGTWMKNSLNDYLEENSDDENTNSNEDVDEDSEEQYMKDENTQFDKDSMGKSKVHTFGRGLYNAMKRIVDED